ncbi:MAG: Ig-like domain-containing protein [Planctomycetes bacterium]|nr:Ig-like domain-containing protein [Planctomycetota bacterium]
MRAARRLLLLTLTAAAAAACWRSPPRSRPFEVVRTSPALGSADAPLLLNDSITVYFSDPVQPLSVTEDSVTLVDDAGRRVPGALRVGANWVTFEPEPPLAADLGDGSFRPGATYRLLVAGSPRSDALRATDGRLLATPSTWQVRIAAEHQRPPGLVSLLRPLAVEMPFLLRPPDLPQRLPVDAPRLLLHFTLPLLPTAVTPEAVTIRLLRNLAVLQPRGLRVVTSRLDQFPGCTLEIDLGSQPLLAKGGTVALRDGDYLSVELNQGPGVLTDYAGSPVLPGMSQSGMALWWNVVEGSSLCLAEWPGAETSYVGEDPLQPAFEVRGGLIRPRVRVEAGDGSLGVFRPQRDTRLCPGEVFDRGDGQLVRSRGADFPFLAIDIAAGVTVTVDASKGPVHLLACGSVRIDGVVELIDDPVPLRVRRFETQARELLAEATIALLTAGDLHLTGVVRSQSRTPTEASPLSVLCAGQMHLSGELPFHTLLAIESPPAGNAAILGARGQAIVAPPVVFTYGVAEGADFWVRGSTPWRQLPSDRDGGTVQLVDVKPGLAVAWQSAPMDPVATGEPDRRVARHSQPQPVLDRDAIVTGAGAFVRLGLAAHMQHGTAIPTARELRLIDR